MSHPRPPFFQAPFAPHDAAPGHVDLLKGQTLDVLLEGLVKEAYANVNSNVSANGNDKKVDGNANASTKANADGNAKANANNNANVKANAKTAAVVADAEAGGGCVPDAGITAHAEEVGGGPPKSQVVGDSVNLDARVSSTDAAPQAEATVDQPTLAGVQEEVRALMGMVHACQAQVGSLGSSLGVLAVKSTAINDMAVDDVGRKEEANKVTGFSAPVGEAPPTEASRTPARVDGRSDLEVKVAAVVEAGAAAGATAGRLEGAKTGEAVGAKAGAAAATAVFAKVAAVERRAVAAETRLEVAEARAAAAEEAVATVTAEATTKATAAAAMATAEVTAAAAAAAEAAAEAAAAAAEEGKLMRRTVEDTHRAEKRSLSCHMLAGILRRRCNRDKFVVLMAFRCAASAARTTEASETSNEDANRARVEAEEKAAKAEAEVEALGRKLWDAVDERVAETTSFLKEQLREANIKLAAANPLAVSRLPDNRTAAAEHSNDFGGVEEEKVEESATSSVRANRASPAAAAAEYAYAARVASIATNSTIATDAGNGAPPPRGNVQVHFQAAADDVG